MRAALVLAAALAASGCLDDWQLEDKSFACREPADCVDGWFCHPTRFVCVVAGTSTVTDGAIFFTTDAGPILDAATGTALIGEACGIDRGCAEGQCVDGVCCSTPCDELCSRCDLQPGTCTPAAEGTDPDGDCGGEVECAAFVYGLRGSACHAHAEAQGQGTCDGQGSCTLRGCEAAGPGVVLVQCGNPECLREAACPQNARISDWNEPGELCAAGQACGGANGLSGCCSPSGLCCPTPACTETDPLCQ